MLEKKSTAQKIVIYLLIVVASLICLHGVYSVFIKPPSEIVMETKASGVITEKYDSAYGCGKGSTCYARYFIVNNVRHSVTLDTYTKYDIGESVVLQQEVQDKNSVLSAFSMIFLFSCVMFLVSFVVVNLVVWLCSNNRK